MSGKVKTKELPHVGLAVFATGVMALALAVGAKILKLIVGVDRFFENVFLPRSMVAATRSLDPASLWLATAFLAFALPAVMLNVPGTWRRLVVWCGTLLLTLSWGPVLLLASYRPEIGVAVVAVLWSGFCAMIYATSHVLPVDAPAGKTNPATDGAR